MTEKGQPSALNHAWKRVGWAHEDRQALFEAIIAFQASEPYMFRIDRYGTYAEAVFTRHAGPDEEARAYDSFARSFGSFLDNCRAALNYTAYQLALLSNEQNSDSGPNPEVVEFPIYTDPEKLRGLWWFRKFPAHIQAALEVWQPDRGNAGLLMLHELSRKYRHRLIHPVAVFPFADQSEVVVDGHVVQVEVLCTGAPLRDNDPILRFPLRDNPDAALDPVIPIGVGIDDETCAGRLCTSVANDIITNTVDATKALLGEFFM